MNIISKLILRQHHINNLKSEPAMNNTDNWENSINNKGK